MILKRLNFKNKLIVSFLIVFIPMFVIGGAIAYYKIKHFLETRIENELNQNLSALHRIIETTAQVAIKTHLSAIAQKNYAIADHYYQKVLSGVLSKEQAIQTIEEIFLSQDIGINGYIYCINSNGDLIVHPENKVKGTNISEYEFVKHQMQTKEGYLEYEWQNPGDESKKPKAIYMRYYHPLDWIISVSAYQEEFKHLVNLDDFRQIVPTIKAGQSGYAYFLNRQGIALIYPDPQIEGTNFSMRKDLPSTFISQILETDSGELEYLWKGPSDPAPRKMVVFFKHLPRYEWIICTSGFLDEIYAPLSSFKLMFFSAVVIILVISYFVTYFVSSTLTSPLASLIKKLETDAKGDFSVRMNYHSPDELGTLSTHFDRFMDRLESMHKQLNSEVAKTRKAQAALVENDLKLRGLFNQAFQFIGILSPLGTLEEINQSAVNFSGLREENLLFKPVWETLWWADHKDSRLLIKQGVEAAMGGRLSRFQIIVPLAKGKQSHCDISIKPVMNNSGKIEFMILEGRDITSLKQIEQEKRQMAVQLEKAHKMEAIGTLAGGIAHDFNNILSSIFGYTQLAEMSLDTPEATKKHLGQILKGAQRAASLVQQILTFSRKTEFEKHPLNIHLILNEALKLLRSSIPTTIEMETIINSRAMVMADATKMHQVIMNLCTNSYQAMEESGGTLTAILDEVSYTELKTIGLKMLLPGEYLVLSIKDTGHGMDKATLEKAFDPYFTTKDIGKGTGFGLALVQAIVEEHQGIVHAESEVGMGTTITVYLPKARGQGCPREPQYPIAPQKGNETIIVVDDESAIRQMIEELLQDFGYRVYTYTNGAECLAAFTDHPDMFDLVITDLTMPKMSGDDLCQRLIEIKENIPIILCTGYSSKISDQEKQALGVKKFLNKPIDNMVLLAEIRNVLDNS